MDTASPLADTRRARDFASLYAPPRIDGNFTGKHILTVEQFARKDLQILFDASTSLKKRSQGVLRPAGHAQHPARDRQPRRPGAQTGPFPSRCAL